MGMYTELFVTARIKDKTSAIDILKYMLNGEPTDLVPDHPLADTDRWHIMLRTSSYYFNPINVSHFEYDHIDECWCLLSYSSFKNYSNEVEHFFNWLRPFVDDVAGTLIGYHRYEEDPQPTPVYL